MQILPNDVKSTLLNCMQSSMKHFQSRMRKQKKRSRITWKFY